MSDRDHRWTTIAEDAGLTAEETVELAPLFAAFVHEPEASPASPRIVHRIWLEAMRAPSGSWARRLAEVLRVGRAQVSLFGLPFWIVSIAVVLAGAAAVATGLDPGRTLVFYLAAPVLACVASWTAFRGQSLGPQELELSTPVSARELVLVRLFLILGYDIAIGLVATIPLIAMGTSTIGAITLTWLSPLILATGATLVISAWTPVERAAALVYAGWVTGVLVVSRLSSLASSAQPSAELAMMIIGFALLAFVAVSLPGRFTLAGSHPA